MQKNQLFAGLILIFIFLLGFVAGGTALHLIYRFHHFYGSPNAPHRPLAGPVPPELGNPPPPDAPPAPPIPLPGAGRGERLLQRLESSLDLRPDQRQAIARELEEVEEAYRTLHQRTRSRAISIASSLPERLRQHLDQNQQYKFDAQFAERLQAFQQPPRGLGPQGSHRPPEDRPHLAPEARQRLRRHLQERLDRLNQLDAPTPPPNQAPSDTDPDN